MAKKQETKIYKAGTKVTLHASCNFVGCDQEDEITLEDDYTEAEMNAMASDFAMDAIAPEGWFVVSEEESD